jgi:hypothetical protein
VKEPRTHTESELVDYMRSIDVRAPQRLHDSIEQLVADRAAPRGRKSTGADAPARTGTLGRRLAAGMALAAAVAAVLVVAFNNGSHDALTVTQASVLTLRPATAAAPQEDRGSDGTELAAAVDGVRFPYWEDHFGWRSTGSRTDHVGGRTVRTVFYGNDRGQRIGYAIVAGVPAPRVGGGVVAWRNGTAYRLLSVGDLRVVTWLRHGRMCVVTGRGVSGATLLTLASWDDQGATPA